MIYTVTLNPALDYELTVPDIIENEPLRASGTRFDFGGKGFNVSRMIATLGGESVALGFVGGKTGERLEAGLAADGIRTSFIWLEEETRINVSIVAQGKYVKANAAGPQVALQKVDALLAQVEALAQPGDWWVLAGSLPRGVPMEIYATLTAILRKKQSIVFIDTSGEPLRHACGARPHWGKPNLSEAAALTGETDPAAAARQMQELGMNSVALTAGERPSWLFTDRGMWQGISPDIEEANPIGAGDSFVGGLVYGLHAGQALDEAFRLALACGTAAASLPGTQIGVPEQIDAIKEKVTVHSVNQVF